MSRERTEVGRVSRQGDRSSNQDRLAVLEADDCCLLVLGDGLGGHARGELAAQLLVDGCTELWHQARKPLADPAAFLRRCIQHAHRAILAAGRHQEPPVSPRTTAVLALLQGGRCHWAHAGDSRFYLIREGRVIARSRDHTVANDRTRPEGSPPPLKPNALTRCLGGGDHNATPALGTPIPLQEGDIVLLCSDGFWNQLDEAQLALTLHNALPLANALRILGEQAEHNAQGHSDNITAVAIRVGTGAFGLTQPTAPGDDEQALLRAIDQLNRIIDKTLRPSTRRRP